MPGVALDEASLTSQLDTGAGGATRPTSRIGGGGFDSYMVDGLTTMSSGINRPTARISAESISEVKVATFGYGAEYGPSSGSHINAVTKSGTNQFHGCTAGRLRCTAGTSEGQGDHYGERRYFHFGGHRCSGCGRLQRHAGTVAQ